MKIGILGGSFDPVHTGHIELAKRALRVGLEKVIFMPTGIQPFKCDNTPAADADRIAMLEIAVAGIPEFEISRHEIDREGLSYTIYTLRAMRELYVGAEIFFIIGIDAFLDIQKWMYAEELLREFSFIIGMRPGCDAQKLTALIAEIRSAYGTTLIEIDNPMIDVTSTEIRECVQSDCWAGTEGKIPEKVKEYIIAHEVYN